MPQALRNLSAGHLHQTLPGAVQILRATSPRDLSGIATGTGDSAGAAGVGVGAWALALGPEHGVQV